LELAFAHLQAVQQEVKNKNAKIEFHVSGTVKCVKKDRKKAALSVSGSKVSDWHMTGTLYLIVNEQKTDVTTIQKRLLL
jgi:hypothetical protein